MIESKIYIPLHLKVIGAILRALSNRAVVIFCSFIVLVAGYLVDCQLQTNSFLAPNSSIVTALGLILTIKHHYLANIVSVNSLVSSDYTQSQFGASVESYAKNKVYVDSLLTKASDEGFGLILILFGTGINAFGSYIPLVTV